MTRHLPGVAQRHFTIFLWSCTLSFWSCIPMLTSTLKFWYHQVHHRYFARCQLESPRQILHGQASSDDKRSPSWAARASSILELNASFFLLSRLWLSISSMPRRASCSRHPSLTFLGDDKHKSLASLSLFLIVWILRVASLPQTLYMSFTCPRCKLKTLNSLKWISLKSPSLYMLGKRKRNDSTDID